MVKEPVNRYSRHTLLEGIGQTGQERLGNSSCAIVGCGALGTTLANHLTRAGIGKIRIIDRDIVELDNLQRQLLFDEKDVGEPKAQVAKEKLDGINSQIEIESYVKDLNCENAEILLKDVDIVLDGTDNMETRYLINDVCVKNDVPWIYGGAVSTYGMTMNIILKKTACLVCAFPYMPRAGSLPTCDTVGVLNTVPAIIASIQATEALKILLEKEYRTELVVYEVWNSDFKQIKIKRNDSCECCADFNFQYLSSKKKENTTVLCGRNSVQIIPAVKGDIDLEDLSFRLTKIGDVKQSPVHLNFEIDDVQITVFRDGRAIIKGTDSETHAKSIYAKYIGN